MHCNDQCHSLVMMMMMIIVMIIITIDTMTVTMTGSVALVNKFSLDTVFVEVSVLTQHNSFDLIPW